MTKGATKRSWASDAAFESAYEAFYDAEYEQCLRILALGGTDKTSGMEGLLLRARALLRAGDTTEAYEASVRASERAADASDLVIANTLRAVLLRARKKLRESTAAFERAAKALAGASSAARAEHAYYVALAAWEDGELLRAETLIEEALPAARDVLAAMLIQLLGWIEVRRERYAAAAERFIDALDILRRSKRPDLRFRGRLIHGLAIIASETIDLKLAKRLEPYHADMRWTTGVSRQHFNTVTCLRFLSLLRGDVERAWFLAREAVGIASSAALRAIAETNAGVLSAVVGDSFAARTQFGSAWALIERVSWSQADEEERIALTNFAIEASGIMPAEARSAVTLYRNITGALDPTLALHGDRRMQAFEAMAAARVSEALGRPKEAIENYERSRQIWVSLDYRMRAALVARDLVRLTGNSRYEHDVKVALSRAPHAWFGQSGTNVAGSSAFAHLTPSQRTILKHLLGGESTSAIAKALGRSAYTVHNHTRRVFAAFEVRSRTALLARCASEGITPDKIA